MPETIPDLNLDEWIRATWYSQKQQLNPFQPANQLSCVTATYRIEPDRTVPFFSGTVVTAYNYANEDGVNGKPVNGRPSPDEDPEITLCARIVNEGNAPQLSKLKVSPCFLPNALSGDYWIIGAGASTPEAEAAGFYDWGIVSSGPPTVEYEDGCTTAEEGNTGSGLWIFTRAKEDPVGVAKALEVLKQKGYTTERLIDVPQAGCRYDTAFIKDDVRA